MGKSEQDIVEMFRKAGRINDALGEAARHGEIKLLREMLEDGANPNTMNSVGSTPLNLAASGGKLEAIRLLFEFGADPNVVDLRKGETALFRCLWAMHPLDVYVSCCVELIRNGARTNIANTSGMTLNELARSRGLSVERLNELSET